MCESLALIWFVVHCDTSVIEALPTLWIGPQPSITMVRNWCSPLISVPNNNDEAVRPVLKAIFDDEEKRSEVTKTTN